MTTAFSSFPQIAASLLFKAQTLACHESLQKFPLLQAGDPPSFCLSQADLTRDVLLDIKSAAFPSLARHMAVKVLANLRHLSLGLQAIYTIGALAGSYPE